MLRARFALSVFSLLACAGGSFAQSSCPGSCPASAQTQSQPAIVRASWHGADKNIVDTAVGAGKFTTLVTALKAAGWAEPLMGEGPFTVFAPTDEAFAKLPKGTVETLLKPENKGKLAAILKYHVVKGAWTAADVSKLEQAVTLNGQRVDIMAKGGKVMIDGATVAMADVKASNGVIHAIDTVLMPSDKDVIETAVGAGKFTTLATALKAAGLVDALKGEGPFTVFAPTDAAFAKLPKGALEDLLKPENKDKLASILKYHVVSGRVYSGDAVKAGTAGTLQGSSVTITSSGAVMIDGARVTDADMDASNGVIHVIDSVIMPK